MAKPFVRIATIQQSQPIVDKEGRPAPWLIRALNDAFSNLAEAINRIAEIPAIKAELEAAVQEAKDAAQAAQTAADNAQSAGDAQAKEASLVTSYVSATVPTPTADDAGDVTIAPHDRVYGDPTIDPTVSVDGGLVATGESPGSIVRIYYVDPERDGGAVTYQFTVDPDPPPVQGNDVHSVGAVQIPTTGTSEGKVIRPPGYVEVSPI